MNNQQQATQRIDSVLEFLDNSSILHLLSDIILYTNTRKLDLDELIQEAHELADEQTSWDRL